MTMSRILDRRYPSPRRQEKIMQHHSRSLWTHIVCVGLAFAPVVAEAMQVQSVIANEATGNAKTAAGVIAVDDHWSAAESGGDSAWLEGMLMPEYRSVDVDGKFTTKAAIVAHAVKSRGSQTMKQQMTIWERAHPVEKKVTIQGDTAILSFLSASPTTKGKLYSSDIFVYVNGRWRALYSQHTELEKD
jgi:hypothetical protein